MCSVLGCDSSRRGAKRFKLPEDPEKRLEWVQFLAAANKQRFKESSWTDITICSEHFKYDCLVYVAPTGSVQLTPGAAPSVCLPPKSVTRAPDLESSTRSVILRITPIQSMITPDACSPCVTRDHGVSPPKSEAKVSRPPPGGWLQYEAALRRTLKSGGLEPEETTEVTSQCNQLSKSTYSEKSRLTSIGVLVPRGVSCPADTSDTQAQPKATLPKMKDNFAVKFSASVPTAEVQHRTKAALTDHSGFSEIVAVIDQGENEAMNETATSSDQGDVDSDEDWKTNDEDTEDDDFEEIISYGFSPINHMLCTECGRFFGNRWPHMCEHKRKPYSCNICGKRCVSENALNRHNRVHSEKYEHRCKYCHITFKTKVDKITHEQIHVTEGKPYKCSECSERFASNKDRQIHLDSHRDPKDLKCHICGIEFLWSRSVERHLAVHTGLKPHKCTECERSFSQASHLKSHMRLHTGERPFKCQHCSKCFNHNVSLKSHVLRYHTSSSGFDKNNEKKKGRARDSRVARGKLKKRGEDSECDHVEEEQDTEEEVKDRMYRPKKRSTGRPIGRPKSSAAANLVVAIQLERTRSNNKARKLQATKSQRTQCSNEESENEPTDSDMNTMDSAGEGGKKSRVEKNTTNNSDNNSNFEPEGRRK